MEHRNNVPARPLGLLLELLSRWHPLSAAFRDALQKAMDIQMVQPKQRLFSLGSHVRYAWYSVDCWAVMYHTLLTGKVEVEQIFQPNDFFTDLRSFLQQERSTMDIGIIHGNTLLRIDQKHFTGLKVYPETAELLQQYQLAQRDWNIWRSDILALSDSEKVATFAERFPLHILPGHICASYLRMTRSRFSAARTHYLKNKG